MPGSEARNVALLPAANKDSFGERPAASASPDKLGNIL